MRIGQAIPATSTTKNTAMRRAYLMCNLACRPMDSINISADCTVHEQIVILFRSCKVLSKEQGSRLNE
jgi:hypothetical protein